MVSPTGASVTPETVLDDEILLGLEVDTTLRIAEMVDEFYASLSAVQLERIRFIGIHDDAWWRIDAEERRRGWAA